MLVAIVANEESKNEMMAHGFQPTMEIVWVEKPVNIPGAAAYIDLLFSSTEKRLEEWQGITSSLIIINDVMKTNDQLPANFVRINGWPTFLNRTIIEAAADDDVKEKAASIFSSFNRQVEWVPDVAGFVSVRVVSMIINEAFFALEENVSSKEEIDTAMKLGTNYPYGPFEWGNKIGLKNIVSLLETLAINNPRYQPAALLKQEAVYQ